ncbi:MAG: hypothetical protein AAGJ35_12775, partial [Myxococcota bacterium]
IISQDTGETQISSSQKVCGDDTDEIAFATQYGPPPHHASPFQHNPGHPSYEIIEAPTDIMLAPKTIRMDQPFSFEQVTDQNVHIHAKLRKGILLLLFTVVLSMSTIMLFRSFRQSKSSGNMIRDPSILRLNISPPNAKVHLNGNPLKQSGSVRTIQLVSGTHYRVQVFHNGYRTDERQLIAREGEIELKVILRPLSPSTP